MSVLQDRQGQPYAWSGAVYLLVVPALHWSRGGSQGAGAAGDLVAFYGARYTLGLLLGLGWWRATRGDRAAR